MNGPKKGQPWEEYIDWYYQDMPAMATYLITERRFNMIPITVGTNTYKSISEAWRETSPPLLKEITVRLRLRNGWSINDAFGLPTVIAEDRRTFKEVRNNK